MSVIYVKYRSANSFDTPVVKANDTDYASSADYTPATADFLVSFDGATAQNLTNLPTFIPGMKALTFSLTTAESLFTRAIITIDDAALEDDSIRLSTELNGQLQADAGIDVYTVNTSSTAALATAFEAVRNRGSEEATDDHFNNRRVLFVSGNLQSQSGAINDYALQNSRGFFTFASGELTEAPVAGDKFVIL